ncbi:hypothetical protein C8J56DRAFT_1027926 [Mycena floridula]|nr:hypothetical protein C8J56DRAFT_1027926 [Mycena floridula]
MSVAFGRNTPQTDGRGPYRLGDESESILGSVLEPRHCRAWITIDEREDFLFASLEAIIKPLVKTPLNYESRVFSALLNVVLGEIPSGSAKFGPRFLRNRIVLKPPYFLQTTHVQHTAIRTITTTATVLCGPSNHGHTNHSKRIPSSFGPEARPKAHSAQNLAEWQQTLDLPAPSVRYRADNGMVQDLALGFKTAEIDRNCDRQVSVPGF